MASLQEAFQEQTALIHNVAENLAEKLAEICNDQMGMLKEHAGYSGNVSARVDAKGTLRVENDQLVPDIQQSFHLDFLDPMPEDMMQHAVETVDRVKMQAVFEAFVETIRDKWKNMQ